MEPLRSLGTCPPWVRDLVKLEPVGYCRELNISRRLVREWSTGSVGCSTFAECLADFSQNTAELFRRFVNCGEYVGVQTSGEVVTTSPWP